jgi:hypothetical protein
VEARVAFLSGNAGVFARFERFPANRWNAAQEKSGAGKLPDQAMTSSSRRPVIFAVSSISNAVFTLILLPIHAS